MTDPAAGIDSPLMRPLEARERLFFTIFVIGFAVFLFACGGAVPSGHQSEQASLAPPEPRPQPAPAPAPVVVEPPPASSAAEDTGSVAPQEGDEAVPAPVEPPEQVSGPEPAPAPPAPAGPEGPHVYTNKDLSRYAKVKEEFGLRDGVVTVDLSGKAAAKEPAQDGQPPSGLTRQEREKQITEARAEMTQLTEEIAYLEKRIPSLHNPFLPRPTLTEEDKLAESGMDNRQRLDRVTDRLAEASARLDATKKRLAELYDTPPVDDPPDAAAGDRD